MKVLLANGSPHKDGFTAHQLDIIGEELAHLGVECIWWQLGMEPVRGCIDCQSCAKTNRCVFPDNNVNEFIEALLEADGVILGSPVYFAGSNGAFSAVLDRAFYATGNWSSLLRGKVGASVVNLWRAGATAALDRLNKYFLAAQMVVATSDYWNLMLNGETIEGDDEFGERMMRILAHNMVDTMAQSAPMRNAR